MISQRQLFLDHLAQTSDSPIGLEIVKAEGVYLEDLSGKKYLDLISGISVSNIGHRHPKVLAAIQNQLDKYLYVMVYGEFIQSPQLTFAKLLTDLLPFSLNSVYFTNSGSEANEGALKLAKRYTNRTEIIAFKNAYHGSTQGALSVMGEENFKRAFRPLLPDIRFISYNNINDLNYISNKTACIIVEPVQGEAGVIIPENDYLKKLRLKCTETGSLLIFDEIQTGFGRTGSLFAFEQFEVVPDILTIAKGMGGGMPIGAFLAQKEIMQSLMSNPVLGHITTFGGHPVCCAAGKACLEALIEENLMEKVKEKELLFRDLLKHPQINEIRSIGLMLAVDFGDPILNKKVINTCISKGVITDWFLFCDHSMRIAPPLTITMAEIKEACNVIIESINASVNSYK